MKKNSQIIILFIFCSIILFSNGFLASASSDSSEEIDKYIEMLNSESSKTRVTAAGMIAKSRLTDPRLYNVINEKLLNGYNIKSLNSGHVDEMSWLCKALAVSGSGDYAPTLEKISQTAPSSKLKKYARQSLVSLWDYAERNKLLSESPGGDSSLSPEINKYINIFQSNNTALKKDTAKFICNTQFSEKKLFDVINAELLKGYPLTGSMGRYYTDALAWMIKALASSGMPEYRPTLMEIIEKSSSQKLQRHAKNSLSMLQ
ncbi:MAG: hypothetical protein KKE44_03105 [Proteobacteria bacterium]|nr:hypothetical protein [Pseudomonadota bacterium]MBU1581715.1 hypothetical protein [Pseudomonadota bacterium]MBU2455949.1 hypothetical protein [Pseudomonadota bacterium]MBU2630119.1 hypothetical protein [Pseudomonadota bacterium]